MKIRKIARSDFSALYTLWQDAGLRLYPPGDEKQRFVKMLQLNPSLLLALTDRNKIIGSILGAFDGRNLSVHRLAISPSYQKKGYGTLLLGKLEKTAKKLGIQKMVVQIHVSNTQVISYYKNKHNYKDMNYVLSLYKDL